MRTVDEGLVGVKVRVKGGKGNCGCVLVLTFEHTLQEFTNATHSTRDKIDGVGGEEVDEKRRATLFERTYHKGLVKLGSQETFLPIITHSLPNSFRHALLDGQGIPGQVVRELWEC